MLRNSKIPILDHFMGERIRKDYSTKEKIIITGEITFVILQKN